MSPGTNTKIGAVLVVGGGIGGTQASLDLAEAGYKVFLLEKEPAIGGVMAQLDKTFPTNDCAMCTLAPRLVDAGRHPNIVKLMDSEVEKVEGAPGNFNVTIKRRARYIDLAKCTGCGVCIEKCPIKLDGEFDEELVKRTAIYRRYPQAVPGGFSISKEGVSPCRFACPASVNAHAYVALVAQKRFKDALEVERRTNPLAAICGRVCPHGCETECTRSQLDEPIAIAAIKRFLADWEAAHPEQRAPLPAIKEKQTEKIAIVGAGPAGLTCARDLAIAGFQVTIYEALPVAGGTLIVGIPEYRLPAAVIAKEIDEMVTQLGVELKLNSPVGEKLSLMDLKKLGFHAMFLGIGATKGLKLEIPGEDEFSGVADAVAFLREVNIAVKVNKAAPKPVSGKVVVIGGGNVAIDSARSAWRLGASEVTIVYRRSRREMPASAWEIAEAEKEGIKIEFLAAPTKVFGANGKVTGIECVRMELGEPDASGRRRPTPVKGSEFTISADMVIPAISQTPDVGALGKEGIKTTKWGTLEVDSVTLESTIPGVFAGGDAVSGPATVIEAIEAGHRAAESIKRFLNGQDMTVDRDAPMWTKAKKEIEGLEKQPRLHMKTIPVEQRRGNFKEVELGYTEEEAVKEAQRCLACATCCECLYCVQACEAKAIQHEMPGEKIENLNVGAIVLAPGFELFNPDVKKELGYDRYPNVITSLEFERILSASGPFMGHIQRLSEDKRTPKKLAFIQCVGSRETDRPYCSSVCCMYATKQAIIAKEHERELDCHVFYIDIRAYGKGFDEYYNRAKELGVKYIRCRPSFIKEVPATKNLIVRYQTEDGKLESAEYDMVVLSSGLRPPAAVEKLADAVGIKLDDNKFALTHRFSPIESSKPGVFVCGPFTEPKDIPETVMQSSGAASKAMAMLADVRGTLIAKMTFPPEIDIKGQEPRIGVFVCHCGKNIGGVANVPSVVEYAKNLPNVVYAQDNLYTCSADTCDKIKQIIIEQKLNRVVVASCTPRTHEPLFQSTCRDAGLNPFLFEMANIRDQNTWVHMQMPEAATEKAKDLVRMAVAKAALLEPLYPAEMSINHDALVIGGGMAGMTAALAIADAGFKVHLVEKEAELGGNMRHIFYLPEGEDPQAYLKQTIERVAKHPNVLLHRSTKVAEVEGFYGHFSTKLVANGTEKKVEHGIIIVATGAEELKPAEYKEFLYGQNDRVMTQVELEEKIHKNNFKAGSVVMIQCVGSRDKTRPYCSRICCYFAVKNALKIKEKSPETEVYVLYRDIRTYGFREALYTKAREAGVRFIRYEEEKKPVVTRGMGVPLPLGEGGGEGRKATPDASAGKLSAGGPAGMPALPDRAGAQSASPLSVTVFDPMLQETVKLDADYVILSAATVPRADTEEVGKMLKVPLTQNKFFLEAHMKLRPVDFQTEGIFLCGLAHCPKTIDESIAQACGAASRACTILAKEKIELEARISEVIDANCDGCAYCVDPCPYKAITLVEFMKDGQLKKTVDVNESLCKGCGSCMATCPKKGVFVRNFKPEQVAAMVEACLQSA
ncbi:MAG: FAD-dependent oxidoreductase [Planctomycetota bacterium]|nr:FAD-dependent oxidoreductase [Planctomycetota bacterium]